MAMLLDPLLSESISTLLKTVLYVAKTTADFNPQLQKLIATLETIQPIIEEIVNRNRALDRTEPECKTFIGKIQKAKILVEKCLKVKRDFIKMFHYSQKLNDFNNELVNFFQIEGQAIQMRDTMEMLAVANDTKSKVDWIYAKLRDSLQITTDSIGNHGGGPESVEREKYGWRVPGLPSGIVAFDEPLETLKAAVVGDYSVLVVEALGGCGKTTLVKMLCHDAKIQKFFGENIFFVTVSETPNFLMIVNQFFYPNSTSLQVGFQSKEDAKNRLEHFFDQKASEPMLLVLDDVWSDSFIEEIGPLKNKGHKILVTSRTTFPSLKYKPFRFDPLNEEDAKTLFRGAAFTEGGSRPCPTIDDNLVNQMVEWCKEHPLTLLVVGRSLNGKDELAWKSMLRKLSHGRLVLDLHKDVLIGLERSFEALDDQLKQCFLDFGLFPEDQRIPVTALLNMWMHLYDHGDDGVDTMNAIVELSYKNIVNLMTTGNVSSSRINYCDQQFVTQHDLLRELAIHLNNKLPLEQRSRLFINAQGKVLPESIEKVQQPMQARILSISTGESFSSRWCNMEVPNLEVLILNLTSKTYTLPLFLAGNPNLKILNITNHGLYPTQFNNFHFLASSHNLTSIRLERVEISPTILSLTNLQKVSFIMCKFDNAFKKLVNNDPNIWPQLVEIEIDYCQELVEFPGTLCDSVHLKNISVTNCNEMCGFKEEFGDLINLEMLSLHSCTKLEKLPESIWKLEKLSVLDISDCLSLSRLPERIGKLSSLRTIYMKGCTGVHELPESVEELSHVRVVCNEEIAYQWHGYSNVKIDLVEEDKLETLMRIILYS